MPKPRAILLTAFAIFALIVALYLPTLRGGFVYDSIAQVLYSDYIHIPAHWADVLTLRVVGQDELDRNRPLHLASLMLDAAIWKKDPFGYRLTSVLLHALNASLLFVFIALALRRRTAVAGAEAWRDIPKANGGATANVAAAACPPLCGSSPPAVLLSAAFGALVFALHPPVVEAVAEPSNREDLLVLLPMLVGLLCIIRPFPRSSFALSVILTLCSFLAVLAKESGIAVPFVFAAACWLFRRNELQKCTFGLIGGLVVAIGFLGASYVWRPIGSVIFSHPPPPLADNFWTIAEVQLRIWTLQFSQVFWPWNLSAHYTADAIAAITLPVATAVMAIVAIAAVFATRADRLAALGVAAYVLCLLPASNFAAQYHPVADRYLYVPLAGLGMIASALANGLRIKYPRGFAGGLPVAGLLVLLCLEYTANLRRQFIWQQPETLWTDVSRQYPHLALAQVGLANVHYRRGDYRSAFGAASEAVLYGEGRWDDAIALKVICAWSAGMHEEAIQFIADLLRISPDYDYENVQRSLGWSPSQASVLKEAFNTFHKRQGVTPNG